VPRVKQNTVSGGYGVAVGGCANVIAAVGIVPVALDLRSRNRNEFPVLATLGENVAVHDPHFGRIAIPLVATAPVGTIRHVPSAIEFIVNGGALRGMIVLRKGGRRKRQGSEHHPDISGPHGMGSPRLQLLPIYRRQIGESRGLARESLAAPGPI
jgi:hypothetical protein